MASEQGFGGAGGEVVIRIPPEASYVALLRTVVGGVAARDNFTLDQIDDFRLATEEAAVQLLKRANGATITARVITSETRMTVRIDAEVSGTQPVIDEDSLSWMILRALVDDMGVDMREGHAAIELSKHRTVFVTQDQG